MGLWDSITWSGSTCRAAERWRAEDTHVRAGEGSSRELAPWPRKEKPAQKGGPTLPELLQQV